MLFFIEAFQTFWLQQPALLYGLASLLGVYAALQWHTILIIPLVFIAFPLLYPSSFSGLKRRLLLSSGIMFGMWSFVSIAYQFPALPPEGAKGIGYFEISSLSSSTTHFGKRWVYKGSLHTFEPTSARNIPITVTLPHNEETKRPLANHSYIIEGTLKEVFGGRYVLSVEKSAPWMPVNGTWSLAEYRYHAKQAVGKYIQNHIQSRRAGVFLTGIATGEFDDRMMQFEFSRFGLQHIMAISGFHFAIIAAILSLLLRLVISKRKAHVILIFLLTSYFFFLGCGPSVMRAWVTISIVLLGFLLERRGSGLNSLGISLAVVLAIDPLMCNHIGFQFSFVTTAAILLMFGLSDVLLQRIFMKRRLSQVVEMNALNQHGYCVLSFLRQSLSLTMAVNLIALPMMLFYFQKFPLMSLLYNLFFPFLVSVSMLLLIIGVLATFALPIVGNVIHAVNERYTQFVLDFTYNMPTTVDVTWRVLEIPVEWIVSYLCVVFGGAIYFKHAMERSNRSLEDFAFL